MATDSSRGRSVPIGGPTLNSDVPPGLPPETDLTTASTNDLIDELFSRVDAALVVLLKRRDDEYGMRFVRYQDPYASIGGAQIAIEVVKRDVWLAEGDDPDDDEPEPEPPFGAP